MTAYYNENDPAAAAWLRVLIGEKLIAPGVVDERSIKEVRAGDLDGFRQCHFFAGIGVWSHALRRAGWPDDHPVWTGSCPCQPFSQAGTQGGFEDPRHLWPDWFRLIGERRPDICFGEQIASAGAWLDLVSSDMEAAGYAFASPDLCAAGFGGAHIRQRTFWVADINTWQYLGVGDTDCGEPGAELGYVGEVCSFPQAKCEPEYGAIVSGRGSSLGGLVDPESEQMGLPRRTREPGGSGPERMGDDDDTGLPFGSWAPDERGAIRFQGPAAGQAGSLLGCDWLLCHDAKLRPVEPGTFPLAHAAPARVGRLRGYGNALDAEVATNFISAYMEAAL